MILQSHCDALYPPHFSCWGGDVLMVWLHTLADSAVALAYFAIPAALFYLARKHRVKRLSSVFAIYGAFILLCGLTHVFDVVTVWRGGYWLYLADGIVRALTGAVSVAAAYVTVRCAADALIQLSRMAVLERRLSERVAELRERVGREGATAGDEEAANLLSEVRSMMRSALNNAEPGREGI